ncbi:MAG TPA: hypothetical protein VJH23_00605 [archaeon]|nr:hypothetical protein [archaeon]
MDSRNLKLLSLFALSYLLLFVLSNVFSNSGIKPWVLGTDIWKLDYMLFFVPIAGFFFIYMLIPYLRSEFGFGSNFIYAFPALFAVFSYLAYQLSVWWYYANQAFLATNGLGILPTGQIGTGAGCGLFLCSDISAFGLDFMALFIGSHFLYFVLAGILGWGSRLLIEHFEAPSETK